MSGPLRIGAVGQCTRRDSNRIEAWSRSDHSIRDSLTDRQAAPNDLLDVLIYDDHLVQTYTDGLVWLIPSQTSCSF